jgi:hypothetical protein
MGHLYPGMMNVSPDSTLILAQLSGHVGEEPSKALVAKGRLVAQCDGPPMLTLSLIE